jgi:hypothetical protein
VRRHRKPKDHDTMPDPTQLLSVDEAMAEFQAIAREVLADMPSGARSAAPAATPQETEDTYFRFAEWILSLACPDPRACADQRCRRGGLCRHYAQLRSMQKNRVSFHARRTPGAQAVRYAVWAYMNTPGAS